MSVYVPMQVLVWFDEETGLARMFETGYMGEDLAMGLLAFQPIPDSCGAHSWPDGLRRIDYDVVTCVNLTCWVMPTGPSQPTSPRAWCYRQWN
ncbi:MAG: hypothetical protein GTO63_24325 [Anaerolineae bacterium]|nr:hypothetical protein [Anaerolineae bacterium]NIN97850.1 hypothetical protein [Anaerolineae bacterium]